MTSSPNYRIRPCAARAVSKVAALLFEVGSDVLTWQEVQAVRAILTEAARRGELPAPMEDRLISQAQLAEALGIGLSTCKKLLATNEIQIPVKHVGGSVRYRWKDVVFWMNAMDDDKLNASSASL